MKQTGYAQASGLNTQNPSIAEIDKSNTPSADDMTAVGHAVDHSSNVLHDGKLYAATHTILEFWGAKHLTDVAVLEDSLKSAAQAAGATLLHIHMHRFSGEGGVTGVALLAESHISVHTWPEHNYAAFDIFMCGNSHPDKAVDLLKHVFEPSKIDLKHIPRGEINI